MRFMQIESVLQSKNRSEPAKNRFSVALLCNEEYLCFRQANSTEATSECLTVFNIWHTSSF